MEPGNPWMTRIQQRQVIRDDPTPANDSARTSSIATAPAATVVNGSLPPDGIKLSNLSSLYDLTLNSKQAVDPWQTRKVRWTSVVLTVITYALVLSDVPRSGSQPQIHLRRLGMGAYSCFGSFAYPVLIWLRENDTFTAYNRSQRIVTQVPTWSYAFDTTSSVLRSVTKDLELPGNSALLCFNYKANCDHLGSLSLEDTFEILDHVVDAVANEPEESLPQILPQPSDPGFYQHTRQVGVLKYRFVDTLFEYLFSRILRNLEVASYRITHFPNSDLTFDPCARRFDRPFLCDAGPVADYALTADPSDPESAAVVFISRTVQEQVKATLHAYENVSDGLVVDVTFLEGFRHPTTFTGGMVVAATTGFEILKLTRVRDCSGSKCKTIRLEDYRFEGDQVLTDIDDWNSLVAILRVTAQMYFIIRLVALFTACYYAFPVAQRSMARSVHLVFSEIPSHVVAYGSPVPIFLYVIAMTIDGSITNTIALIGGLRLQGSWLKDPIRNFQLICVLMRRQWLLAAVTMLWIELQVMSTQWDRLRGVVSVRGHIFGILSAMSMVLGYHHPYFRDCRILEVAQANPDLSVLNTNLHTREMSNQQVSGIVSDLLSMLACAVIYLLWVILVRLIFDVGVSRVHAYRRHRSAQVANVQPACDEQENGLMAVKGDVFFCRTQLLPTTCTTLWSPLGLTCGWNSDVMLWLCGAQCRQRQPSIAYKDTVMLMNIVQLSDPLNYLLWVTNFSGTTIFTYCDVATNTIFDVAEDLEEVHAFAPERRANRFTLIQKRAAHEMPFHELVRCC